MYLWMFLWPALVLGAPPPAETRAEVRPLADSVHNALDAIIAAGPLKASLTDLLTLPWADASRGPADVWLSHVRIHADKAGGQRLEVWTLHRLAEGVDDGPSDTLTFEAIPGVKDAPLVRARTVCPTGAQTRAEPAPLTESAPVERNRAFTAIRDAVVRLPPLKGGCFREVHSVTYRHPMLLDTPYDLGIWPHVHNAIDQRITISADPGIPLEGAMHHGDAPPRAVPVEVLADGASAVSLGARRKSLQEHVSRPAQALTWAIGSATWRDLSAACAARVEPILASPLPPATFPRVAKGRTPLHTVRAIANQVRERLDVQPLDWSAVAFVVSKPSDILPRRFATDFDFAIALAAALRSEGFDAHIAFAASHAASLPGAGDRPGRDATDHAFVFVAGRGNEPPIWVDAKTPGIPAGAVPYDLVGERAWLCASHPLAASGLLDLHANSGSLDVVHAKRHAVVEHFAPTRITTAMRFDGPRADVLRQYTGRAYPNGLKNELHWVAGRALAGEFVAVAMTHDDGVGPWVATVESDGRVETDDWHVLVLPGAYFDAWNYLPPPLEPDRGIEAQAFVFAYPFRFSSETILELPPGFEPDAPLPSLEVQLGPATWRYSSSFTRGAPGKRATLTTTTMLDFGPARWSREEVQSFRDALISYRTGELENITFSHRAYDALASGDATVGAKLFQALLAEFPADPTTVALLALAWSQRGVMPLAYATLRAANPAHRDHPLMLVVEAVLLDTASKGRGGAEVVEGSAYMTAWRKAFDATPGHVAVAIAFARALIGPGMYWYTPSPDDREEGLGRLRTMALVDGEAGALTIYLESLWHIGQMAQLLADATSQPIPDEAMYLVLAARLVTEGLEGLAAELKRFAAANRKKKLPESTLLDMVKVLMAGNHWSALAELAPRDPVVTPLIRFGKRFANMGQAPAPAIDRRNPQSVATAYLLAFHGTESFTTRHGGDVIVAMTHDDFQPLARAYNLDHALLWRSLGPRLSSLTHASIVTGMPDAFRTREGDGKTGIRLEVQLPERREVVHLAPRKPGSAEWGVIPPNGDGAPLYDHAVKLALAGDDAGARLWFDWAEGVRSKASLRTSTPSLATDARTVLEDATGFALVALPTDDTLAHAIRTLRPDAHLGWSDVGRILMARGRYQEAHAAFLRLPEDLRAASDVALSARLMAMPAADAKAWVSAHVQSIPRTAAFSRAIMRLAPHVRDAAWTAAMMDARVALGEETVSTNNHVWAHLMANTLTDTLETAIRAEVEQQRAAIRKQLAVHDPDTFAAQSQGQPPRVLPPVVLRRALHTLACVLLARGKADEAVDVVALALPFDQPLGPWDYLLLAQLLAALGFDAEAARFAAHIDAEALRQEPDLAVLLQRTVPGHRTPAPSKPRR